MSGQGVFVGFGFGAIQAGLFLHEAHRTGEFSRLVVAEVVPEVIAAIRANNHCFTLNIAHEDHIETVTIGPVELLQPNDAADRERLVEAIAASTEMATALPSVSFYASERPGSVHRLLAEGLARKQKEGGPPAILCAAENHNHAAEILTQHVVTLDTSAVNGAQFLNTVIGKMSGVVSLGGAAGHSPLASIAPTLDRAFLVEAFNRILVSQLHAGKDGRRPQRALRVFEEKPDLLPFEEAKLYGHNAIHAMGGYLAALMKLDTFDQLAAHPEVMNLLRETFLHESGAALIRKHAGIDPLFTEAGFTDYADDLLKRMVNPFLGDAIERVTRDTPRKLGWSDRLVGSMRLALAEGIAPRRMSLGVAAAYLSIHPEGWYEPETAVQWMKEQLSFSGGAPEEVATVAEFLPPAIKALKLWHEHGYLASPNIP